jgi:DNA-binding NtrC family response regulator
MRLALSSPIRALDFDRVALPRRVRAEAGIWRSIVTKAIAKKQILVVDDEEDVRRALKEVLRREGYSVQVAADGVEAMALADASRFDVVFTDLMMPRCDGRELLGRLLAREPAPRVVLITAFGDWDSYVDAITAGAFDYLTKPIRKEEIVRVAKKAMRGSEGGPAGKGHPQARGRL